MGTKGIHENVSFKCEEILDGIISFGEWVQARRNQLGLTRSGLAKLIGCAPITIKKIERDERRPSFQIAELLAEHLQIPQSEQEDFIRRARGKFVPTLISPEEMTLAEAQAPATEEDTLKHNLPPQTTPFFGREQELNDIAKNLANPTCRLLTILGTGGMGKTRLSIEAATQQLGNFTDGITYVELAPVGEVSSSREVTPLAGALADSLNISFHAQAPPEEQLFAYLKRKEMLIVFDNFEHLLDTAVFLPQLLQHAPDIKLLVTSRERLNIQEEWLFTLRGLSYSESESSAMQLFTQRAQQVKPNFDLKSEELQVLRICQLVEGMPLGLELAASWVRQLSCEEIADEIEAELDFLSTQMRNVPNRQRSLRAVFAHSWEKLPEQEQNALMKLSVFRGGFERHAAKNVAQASLPILTRLVDQSLLAVEENGRYQIHELLRQFSAEKLEQSAEAKEQAQSHHSNYYFHFLHKQEPRLIGADAKKAITAIRADIDNVRKAWQWLILNLPEQLTLEGIHSLGLFYEAEGWFLESKTVFEQAALRQEPQLLQQTKDGTHSYSYLTYGLMQGFRAFACVRLGHRALAESILRQSLEILETSGQKNHWVGIFCQIFLAVTLHYRNQLDLSHVHWKELIQTLETVDDPYTKGFLLAPFAQFLLTIGQYDEAEQHAQESNRILTELNNQFFRPFNFSTLGRVAMARGHYEKAEKFHQEAMAQRTHVGTRAGIAYTWSDLGDVAFLQNNLDQAQWYFNQLLTFEAEHNLESNSTNVRLGFVAAAKGNYPLAKQYLENIKKKAIREQWTVTRAGWVFLEDNEIKNAKQLFLNDLKIYEAQRPPTALDAIAGCAHLTALEGQPSRSLELITFVLNHPATAHETKERVVSLKKELEAELPADLVVKAEARGKGLDLWETVSSIITEGTGT